MNIYELWSVDTNGHELYQVDSHGAALRQMAEAGKIQQVSIASPWSLDGEFLSDEFVTQKRGCHQDVSSMNFAPFFPRLRSLGLILFLLGGVL